MILGLDKFVSGIYNTVVLSPSTSISFNDFKPYIVYGWRRDKVYLYIGQSRRFLRRVTSGHHIIGVKESVRQTDRLDIWFCVSKEDLNTVESALIKYHKPKYNNEVSKGNEHPWTKESFRKQEQLKKLKEDNRKFLIQARNRRLAKEKDFKSLMENDIDRLKSSLS